MRLLAALLSAALVCTAAAARAEEPDHAIHEELRGVLRAVVGAINAGDYDRMLPYLTENVEATSVTQEVMSSRADVSAYFKAWFGPAGYMRGKALEHYEAKDGDRFDFVTRWTAVLVRGDDGKWRLRAIHFGTNHLDNPVLTKVSRTLIRDGIVGAVVALLVGLAAGWWLGRRRRAAAAA